MPSKAGAEEDEDAVVVIPDRALEYTIRRSLMKPYGDIYESDLANMESLHNVYEGGVSDLEGLQYCTGLSSLNLYGADVGDLRPISHLPNLEILDLTSCGVANTFTELSPLRCLTG